MSSFPFDYTLPPELIAQEPCEPRDAARLLVAHRHDRSLHHHHFHEVPHLLAPGDLLILNDTRVVPARLIGRRASTGGKWEGLFLRQHPDGRWEMLCQTRGTLKAGEIIDIDAPPGKPRAAFRLGHDDDVHGPATENGLRRCLPLKLLNKLPDGRWVAVPLSAFPTAALLEEYGRVPLPPYIRKGAAKEEDSERYQTIYARQAGAVAAPTAGLHFTQRVFDGLQARGITWAYVTLHVGIGTFQPIQAADYTKHPMHSEWGCLPEGTAAAIRACKARGGRVIAVGTTSVRVLESAARLEPVQTWSGETDIYIYPPYQFKLVDAIVTNFHLPRTTLLLLVAAFAGVDLMRQAYETAIVERYRFYSYGDAMLILP